MPKVYRTTALERDDVPRFDGAPLLAESDLNAMDLAKKRFGPHVPFVLWEGVRHVLTYTPLEVFLRREVRVGRAGMQTVDGQLPGRSSSRMPA